MIESEKGSLWVVFNDNMQDETATLKLPTRYSQATCLGSRAARPIVNNARQLTVPYQDVVVLLPGYGFSSNRPG